MSTKWNTKVLGKGSSADFGELLREEFAIILLQGKNVFGDLVYCYIKATLPNSAKLQAALQADANFNASDFGTVIAAGRGNPPDEVRNEIATTYKLFDQPKPMLTAAIAAADTIPDEKKAWDEY